MTDTKKCGTFLVKISRLADGKCIVFSGRPSDAVVLSLLAHIPPTKSMEHYRFVCKNASVSVSFDQVTSYSFLVTGRISYPRRFTLRAPHRPLLRSVIQSYEFSERLLLEQFEPLLAQLEGAGHEWSKAD